MNCMNCGSAVSPGVKFCPRCGSPQAHQPAPPYAPPYEPPGGQMQTSWDAGPQGQQPPRRKSRAGKILLIVFGVLLLIGAGASLAAYYGYRYLESSLKSSEAYQLAEKELKRSAAVAERLGEIKSTGFPVGSFKVDADGSGNATYTVAVEGTKASGRYFVLMEREAGKWKIVRAFVHMSDDMEPVNVVGEAEGGEGPGGEKVPEGDDTGAAPPDRNASGPKTISGGVLNGKAISKPAPPYPAIAKTAKASGTVVVQVEVDERGRVTKAQASSGHPLLRAAAEAAARQARLSPTLLSGKPVRVSGVLTYEFKPE